MPNIIIMRGLPASGKTYRAKEILREDGNTVRVNKDLLRKMLHFNKFTGKNESLTQIGEKALAKAFLSVGKNVLVDDTNLNPRVLESWKQLAKNADAQIRYEDFSGVSVNVCIDRDNLRSEDERVGQHVIKQMALQYLGYERGEKYVICDLDGTLCNIDHRLSYVKQEPKDWNSFFEELYNDKLRLEVWGQVCKTLTEYNADLILVSARPEKYRGATEDWLKSNLITGYEVLIMRENKDRRDDTIVKEEIFNKYLKNLDIVKVFDDRPRIIRMWKEKGLDVIDVGSGIDF